MTTMAAAIAPAPPTAATAPPLSEHALAAAAHTVLQLARARVHRLQRALVLGPGDDEALDAAVVAYRAASVQALQWCVPVEPHDRPSPEERLAGWLLEAIQQQRGHRVA